MTTAYDTWDYHAAGARRAGQPEEQGFVHIGLYLAWLIRNDLHNAELINDDEWATAIRSGQITGSDLRDALDGMLVSDCMTAQGEAFSDAHYEDYLADCEEVFATDPDYGVPDSSESYARIAPRLDRRYLAWVGAGRPSRDWRG